MNTTVLQGLEARRNAVPLHSDRPYESDLFADVVIDLDDGPFLLRRAMDAARSHPAVVAVLERAEGAAQREALIGSVAKLARRRAEAARRRSHEHGPYDD
jgi:hypothetical protein